MTVRAGLFLKKLHQDILSHFFDGLNCGSSVGKPKNNGYANKEKHQRVNSKVKRKKDADG